MNKILSILMMCLITVSLSAQNSSIQKRVESHLMIGGGLFRAFGSNVGNLNSGVVVRAAYGFDTQLGEKWSVMPGVGFKAWLAKQGNEYGGGDHSMSLADVFCQARYHFAVGKNSLVVGLGPQISYAVKPDFYHISDLNNALNGKEVFNRWDVDLLPSLSFRFGKHWMLGLEASVGLTNMRRQYPEYSSTGSTYLHNLMFVTGFRF